MINGPPQFPMDNKTQLRIRSVFFAAGLTFAVAGAVVPAVVLVVVFCLWLFILSEI
ncbi:hypothetical protein HanIR_Chr04g0172011 [Helianthus annuus]|nr:hypothetical protein HanIR_Chr04g0172011 [Helianthus annuus]